MRKTALVTLWPKRASHAPRQVVTFKKTAFQNTMLIIPLKLLKVFTGATALSFKSIWLHLGHINAADNVKIFACLPVESRKMARSSVLNQTNKSEERAVLRDSTDKQAEVQYLQRYFR
jgi:hypothetical protein